MNVVIMLLLVSFLTGCGLNISKEPAYEIVQEQGDNYLYVDDILYHQQIYRADQRAETGISESGKYQWIFAKGIGEKIGTYDSGSRTYAIHSIIGDENRDFLYSEIDGFHFGPMDSRVWLRNGVELREPDAGTVSEIAIEDKDGEILKKIQDADRIKELLDAYENGNRIFQPEKAEDWQLYTMALCHAQYPFLRYEIEGIFSPSLEMAGCHNAYSKGQESIELPEEWVKIFQSIKTKE